MEYKKLGPTDISIPEIGWGTWNYSGATEPLRAGIDRGAFLIDTAETYGTEELVGRAIRGRRHRVFLATKAAPRHFRRKALIAAAEDSLRKLGSDYIDLYQLHWPNYTVPVEETLAAMEELADAGKIRFIGVSNFGVRDLMRAQAALRKHRIVSVQMRYSLVDRTIEQDVADFCRQNQITLLAYSPLATNWGRLKAADPEGVLPKIALRSGKTEAQIALNWLIAKENVVALVKASTLSHVVEDCEASGWRLDQADYDLMDAGISYRRVRRHWLRSTLSRYKMLAYQVAGREL